MLVSHRRTGACAALRWDDGAKRYLCGVISRPAELTRWQHPWWLHLLQRVARRHIAAGVGCDADIEAISIDKSLYKE